MSFDEFLSLIEADQFKSEHLDLSEAALNNQAIERLISILTKQQQITSLDLSGTAITDENIKKIITLIHLKVLDLSNNRIKEEGITALASSQLEKLGLSNTGLTNQQLKILAANQCLQELTLNNNPRLTAEGFQTLKATKIKTLRICNFFRKGDEMASALAGENAPFVELILIQNGITDLGAKALAKNKQLKVLNLFLNKITFSGIQELISTLTLKNLNLRNNSLSPIELNQVEEIVSKKFRVSNNSSSMFYANDEIDIDSILERLAIIENRNPEILAQIFLKLPKSFNLATELSKSYNQEIDMKDNVGLTT